jgi:hypothetical protein
MRDHRAGWLRRFPDANAGGASDHQRFVHSRGRGAKRAPIGAAFARRHADHAVFATDTGGYGTLQEALLLERVGLRAQPDVVIWGFCDNDPT